MSRPTEREKQEGEQGQGKGESLPPAGPHAKPELTNEDATPGAGYLPDPGSGPDDAAGAD